MHNRVSADRIVLGPVVASTAVSVDEIRKVLHDAAMNHRTITYGELMGRFGLARGDSGRTVIGMLSEVDKGEISAKAPGFAAIVVRKDTGYPGGGFFCWDDVPPELRRPRERCSDPKLSQVEKSYVRKQQQRVWEYYGPTGLAQ